MRTLNLSLLLLIIIPFTKVSAQQSRVEQMEYAIDRYLGRNFDTRIPFFTYVGNVEIRTISQNKDGSFSVTGRFDYNNFIGFRVKRSFRASIRLLLDMYSVGKFEFHYPTDIDEKNWEWKEV